MPAVPGAHLILVHADLALASFETRFNAGARLDHARQFRGRRRLQIAHRGGAGHPQHIALTALAQVVAKPRMAPQFIVTRDPAVRHQLTPRVEHLHALLLSRLITDFWWHVACLTSLLVSGP